MGDELAQVREIYLLITEFLVSYSFQIIGSLIVLVLVLIVARRLAQFVQALLLRVTPSSFTAPSIKILGLATAVIVALGKLGISVTAFIATLGALGLGAGIHAALSSAGMPYPQRDIRTLQ
jgi:small conductance mechanosensitive channel